MMNCVELSIHLPVTVLGELPSYGRTPSGLRMEQRARVFQGALAALLGFGVFRNKSGVTCDSQVPNS